MIPETLPLGRRALSGFRRPGAFRALLALTLCLSLATPAWSINSRAGTAAAQFLKLGAGSRAGAMGEAYSAVADDVYAVYYNPGALTLLTRPQLAAAHTQHFQDIDYEFAAFAYPLKVENGYARHSLAAAIYSLGISDLERRTGDTASPTGTFDAGDYSYNLSYAYRVDRKLGVGVTGKWIHQTIDSFSSNAYALDAGLLFRPRPDAARPFSFAMVLKNVGTEVDFAGVKDPLPVGLTLGAGTCILPKRLKVDVDLTKFRDTDIFIAAGTEYLHSFAPGITGAFRAGLSTHRRENEGFNELSLGAGINFHRASFDFAWVPFGVLGNTFRYSLMIRFDTPPTKPSK